MRCFKGLQSIGLLCVGPGTRLRCTVFFLWLLSLPLTFGGVVFETDSPYHHIQILDEAGRRTLSFDGSTETKMALDDPLQGHFEYTEYFHMPWLWNGNISNVLMIGLGGASTQRSFEHYYPHVTVETAEIDPVVERIAKQFFHFKESPRQQAHIEDGRVFLRRSQRKYDLIILDAYRKAPYGSFIPYHLATKEIFEVATNHLTDRGVLAYNVIGTTAGFQADILGTVYRTMKTAFPQVYLFPARQSQNVVLLGTKSPEKATFNVLHQRATFLIQQKRVTHPNFRNRIYSFRAEPPLNANRCPILTDDYAPVDGLLTSGRRSDARR